MGMRCVFHISSTLLLLAYDTSSTFVRQSFIQAAVIHVIHVFPLLFTALALDKPSSASSYLPPPPPPPPPPPTGLRPGEVNALPPSHSTFNPNSSSSKFAGERSPKDGVASASPGAGNSLIRASRDEVRDDLLSLPLPPLPPPASPVLVTLLSPNISLCL